MDIFANLFDSATGLAGYILPFLFVLTIVVFIHELGHFLVGRWCGVTIKAFSVGFGPELFGFNDKHGTRWRFALIPLGGYVKFLGDESAASTPDREGLEAMDETERSNTLEGKSVWQRMAIVAAGPIANFLLAIVVFTGLYAFVGRYEIAPIVDAVVEGSAAEKAGFKQGDVIVKVDGAEIKAFADVQKIVSVSAEKTLQIDVKRQESLVTLTAIPDRRETRDKFGNTMTIGVLGLHRKPGRDGLIFKTYPIHEATYQAVKETWFILTRTLIYVKDIIVGHESAEQLGGPIRVAKMSGDVASVGFVPLINMMAVLSISIGLINLFPIPLLDGGHLVYYAYEAIAGKPLSPKAQDFGFRIGLALVLMLMIFATWNDISFLSKP